MISRKEFIIKSLELNLFFARIMKEHSIFLQAGFMQKNSNLIHQTKTFQDRFEYLLVQTMSISNGIISNDVVKSNEVVTKYTLDAEEITEFYTGIPINTSITKTEKRLVGSNNIIFMPIMEQRVFILNQNAISLTKDIIQFKSKILSSVLDCKLFTANYPLLIDHILREAKLYLNMLNKLQNREKINVEEFISEEAFWNQIMGEHAEFIRGMLDPSEEELMSMTNDFVKEFDKLTEKAKEATYREELCKKVTMESLEETKKIKDFKEQGTKGLLECKINSIIFPLLADHVLREANYYLRLLNVLKEKE